MATLAAVLVFCAAGLTALAMQLRCVDAAREAARLAARGADGAAAAERVGPAGAVLDLRRDGGFIIARVSAKSPLLPGLTLAAEAVAAAEPGQ
ncbi:TadE family type IV pilus minor pilin [Mycobacterium sp. BMJ-28]